jgi:hypothetical protein
MTLAAIAAATAFFPVSYGAANRTDYQKNQPNGKYNIPKIHSVTIP